MPGLLCIIAHPDDEFFCAGLLLKLRAKGIPVHILCLTRGEGGSLGSPPLAIRETIGQVREQEMQRSARILDADSLGFLDYVDPVPVGDTDLHAPVHDPATLRADIIAAIQRCLPEVVLTHGSNGDYGHPAHILAHAMVKSAIISLGDLAPCMYSFNAFSPNSDWRDMVNRDDWADFVIDTAPFIERKIAVLESHVTQWDAFVSRKDHPSDARAAIAEYVRSLSREGYCRHWPLGIDQRQDSLRVWLGIKPASNGLLRTLESVQSGMRKHGYFFLRRLKSSAHKVRDGVLHRRA